MAAHAVSQGSVFPMDRRLGAAVLAGTAWSAAALSAASYPSHVRVAVLETQAGDPLAGLGADAHLAGIALLLLLAQVLSVRGHGSRLSGIRLARGWDDLSIALRRSPPVLRAPSVVFAVRVLTWVAFAALVMGAVLADGLVSSTDCFRSCAPFPR